MIAQPFCNVAPRQLLDANLRSALQQQQPDDHSTNIQQQQLACNNYVQYVVPEATPEAQPPVSSRLLSERIGKETPASLAQVYHVI